MTRHLLDEVLDAKAAAEAARKPAAVILAAPETAQGVREIPRACSCTWRPHYGTLPATWTLARTDRSCRLHGTPDGAAA